MGNYIVRTTFFLILIAFFCGDLIHPQENPSQSDKFLVGSLLANTQNSQRWQTQYSNYDQVLECGLNTICQTAIKHFQSGNVNQQSNLASLALFPYVYAANDSGTGANTPRMNAQWWNVDWIAYFTQAKYRNWEAEIEDLFQDKHIGILRHNGEEYNINGIKGYSTNEYTQEGDTIITGPNYWQYPRYTFTNVSWNTTPIEYKLVFWMKIDTPCYDSTLAVCRIWVTNTDSTGDETILSYNGSPSIDTVYAYQLFSNEYTGIPLEYDYKGLFSDLPENQDYPPLPGDPEIINSPGYNLGSKVQFKVQWLGNRQLYIDRIEVYDRLIYEHYFIDYQNELIDSIVTYDNKFKTDNPLFYSKLKYYNTMDEPHSLDCYEPIRKLQDILDNNTNISADLLTHWYPGWGGRREGDATWPYYEALMQPHQVMFWYAPFSLDQNGNERNRDFTLYFLKDNLQKAQDVDPDFYATLQTWGTKNGDTYEGYYTPPAAGINAETMLALAHGARGIFYELYYSYRTSAPYFVEALVDTMVADSFARGSNWYKVQEIASRLNGTLGETLMTLDYDASGEDNGFLRLYPYSTVGDMNDKTTGTSESSRYLELYVVVGEQTPVNFHTGFFKKQVDNNYFLLTNVVTTMSKVAGIKVFPPDEASNYNNYRFRNIEPQYNFDSTFTDSMMIDLDFPAGEGYLFQVAPVIKYGGRLLYDELTGDGITLTDDMVIDNGAELSVYEDYYADGNIIIKNGSIINQEHGRIHFGNGKKLIIEGNASIHGASQDKLTFDFVAPGSSNGIVINSGGTLNMTYCVIKNALTGINVGTNYSASSSTLNIQYVDFENCLNSGIAVRGESGDQIPSLPPPVIMHCSIDFSDYGIWVSNLAQVLIRENDITNTNMGIFLSDVPAPQVIGNTIQTATHQLPGIFLESSNGLVRSNRISGHTNGIHLGNSSPDIGGNTIENNLNRGLYVGSGSLPDMRGRLARDPEHINVWYAVSGYNKIRNNGGWSPDDDGSEIFINNAGISMKSGCNEITDQRIPDSRENPQLYNTRLLMNCSTSSSQIEVHAELNFWDEHPLYPLEGRFGDCIVYFDPVTDPCPLPEEGGGRLVIKSSSGEVFDTLYAEQRDVGILNETETEYAAAEEKFLTADYQGAETIYNGIISGDDSIDVKLDAYRRLFEIGKLLRRDENYFSDLRDSYLSIAGNINDSLLAGIFNHLSTLSLVAREEYIPAIGEFDEIIQQNPNTEEAVYAEIDAVTAALLIEGVDTTLNKTGLGKYLVKPGSNYFTRMDEIIRKNFGSGAEPENENIIPAEYLLYNNYPNPFNPSTTIRFDIPEKTEVELVVYDVLGRKVKSLISNEVKNPGRYEVSFDAGQLASGVYIYKLTTRNYSQALKMLLIK